MGSSPEAAVAATPTALRPLVRAPEPAFLWVRYAPRGWPPPAAPWTDLARGGLGARPGDRGAGSASEPLPEVEGGPFDDLLWLPPVPEGSESAGGADLDTEARDGAETAVASPTKTPDPAAAALAATVEGAGGRGDERDRIALRHLEAGTPVLLQVLAQPGGRPAAPHPEVLDAGAVVLHDLLPALLAADLDTLRALPPGAAALWPLVPGCTDAPDLWSAGCGALSAAGVAVVQTVVPRLSPADRRLLSERTEGDAFDRLFHGADPDERAFARVAAAAGLEVFLPRPLPRPPATGQEARRIAAALFLVADLWLRLGRAPSQGQAFFRAARWIDDSGYDPAALAREGNLGVVEVIGDAERALIEDAVERGGRPALLEELLAEYTT